MALPPLEELGTVLLSGVARDNECDEDIEADEVYGKQNRLVDVIRWKTSKNKLEGSYLPDCRTPVCCEDVGGENA